MRPEGVAAATRELRRAGRATNRFMSAETFEDFEDAWADFLGHANKVYLKLRAACHGQGVDWTWWKKKMNERRDEPLLAYIHHARNSDTHRLEETTQRMPAGSHVADIPGLGPVHYSGPNHLRALPVIDCGVVYPVPTEFRDTKLIYANVGHICLLAQLHLQDLVAEAASRLR